MLGVVLEVLVAVEISESIARFETVELFRSQDMLLRKEREARTADETALIGEETALLIDSSLFDPQGNKDAGQDADAGTDPT